MNTNKNNNLIKVIAQAFYGNRVATEIAEDAFDNFILGNLDNVIGKGEKFDRTIVRIPNDDNLVIIYNKYQEAEQIEYLKEHNYDMNALAYIPNKNLNIYSRCVACRMDADGNIESVQNGDYAKIIQYFAE